MKFDESFALNIFQYENEHLMRGIYHCIKHDGWHF